MSINSSLTALPATQYYSERRHNIHCVMVNIMSNTVPLDSSPYVLNSPKTSRRVIRIKTSAVIVLIVFMHYLPAAQPSSLWALPQYSLPLASPKSSLLWDLTQPSLHWDLSQSSLLWLYYNFLGLKHSLPLSFTTTLSNFALTQWYVNCKDYNSTTSTEHMTVVTLLIYPLHLLAQQHVNKKDFNSTTSTVNHPIKKSTIVDKYCC